MCEELLNKSIAECDFAVRTYNCLRRCGINTIGDLINHIKENGKNWNERVRNLGKQSLKEIEEYLTKQGVKIKYNKKNETEIDQHKVKEHFIRVRCLKNYNNFIENDIYACVGTNNGMQVCYENKEKDTSYETFFTSCNEEYKLVLVNENGEEIFIAEKK